MGKQPKNSFSQMIDALIDERGWSRNYLSDKANLSRDFLRKFADRPEGAAPDSQSVAKLAAALDIDPAILFRAVAPKISGSAHRPVSANSDIPILGVATGGVLGAFKISDTPIGYVPRPPGLATVPDAYALYIRSDSMHPMHSSGDLRFVHPHKPPRIDDSVIIQVTESDSVEGYIKKYKGINGEWLVCEQLNPASEVKFKRSTVIHVHHVMTLNELFNA